MERGQNLFVPIEKPNKPDLNLKLVKIDLLNQDQELVFADCVMEFEFWWKIERTRVHWEILNFIKRMLMRGKLYNKKPHEEGSRHLNVESAEAKKFLESNEVRYTELDMAMFDHMYEWLKELDKPSSPWTKDVNYQNKRVYWRKDEQMGSLTFLTDIIIEAPLIDVCACFDNSSVMEDMFKDFEGLKFLK